MPALGSNPGQAANVQHKEGASAPSFILDAIDKDNRYVFSAGPTLYQQLMETG